LAQETRRKDGTGQEDFEELLNAFGTSFEEVQKEDAERKAVAAAKKA
jgi:hypothetical protein